MRPQFFNPVTGLTGKINGIPMFELQLDQVTKVYPGVVALSDVSLAIKAGEVVGLIGENGAGKSTLMKVLGGSIAPNSGHIRLNGQSFASLSPAQATKLGIAFVHQELNPFTNLDVTANILLGREITRGAFKALDIPAMEKIVEPILQQLDAKFHPRAMVSGLSLAEQQLLEIARALSQNARLVIFDEPTSSLTMSETERLLSIIDGLRQQDVAILFISHRLSEITQCADRVVVLRDGQNAGELEKSQITKPAMIRLMIGRDITPNTDEPQNTPGKPVLELRKVATQRYPAARVNLTLKCGEIMGLSGLVGAGRTELVRAVFGIDGLRQGQIILNGNPLPPCSVAAALDAGLCLVPEDRKEAGLILDFEIADNIALPNLRIVSKRGVVDKPSLRKLAERGKQRLNIKAASLHSVTAELSGGNQQKVGLAKWLEMQPTVLIFDEPTRGVDVGAKIEIYQLLRSLAQQGVGILMVSSDMEEVISVSDRVAVMRNGEISGILEKKEMSEQNILSLAVG